MQLSQSYPIKPINFHFPLTFLKRHKATAPWNSDASFLYLANTLLTRAFTASHSLARFLNRSMWPFITALVKRHRNFALTRVCSGGNRWIASVHQANKNYCWIWIAIDRARKRFISCVWAAVIPRPDDSCGGDSGQKYRMPEDRLLARRLALCTGRDAEEIEKQRPIPLRVIIAGFVIYWRG